MLIVPSVFSVFALSCARVLVQLDASAVGDGKKIKGKIETILKSSGAGLLPDISTSMKLIFLLIIFLLLIQRTTFSPKTTPVQLQLIDSHFPSDNTIQYLVS
mmetsp:Transcript_15936/g.19770  ORF Transcript_15936/g.19770 Transcript_15936/m.19770 type:complete len:102 (+) Transcript_15936:226-531(+)